MWITRPSGCRPCSWTSLSSAQALQILHRVVEQAVGRPAIVVERDRVRVRQLAGQLHLALEPGDGLLVGRQRVEQLHRHRPAHQRVMAAKHRAEPARADLLVERVLPELLGLERRLARRLVKAPRQPHQQKHRDRASTSSPKSEPEAERAGSATAPAPRPRPSPSPGPCQSPAATVHAPTTGTPR